MFWLSLLSLNIFDPSRDTQLFPSLPVIPPTDTNVAVAGRRKGGFALIGSSIFVTLRHSVSCVPVSRVLFCFFLFFSYGKKTKSAKSQLNQL